MLIVTLDKKPVSHNVWHILSQGAHNFTEHSSPFHDTQQSQLRSIFPKLCMSTFVEKMTLAGLIS